jgi:hypothetical protein
MFSFGSESEFVEIMKLKRLKKILGFIVIPRQSQLEFKRIKVEPGEQI